MCIVVAVVLTGCGGGGNAIFPSDYQRPSWGLTNGKIAFAWIGGNAAGTYIATIPQGGGGQTNITPSNNPQSGLEGGYDPSFDAAGDKLVIVSKRVNQTNDGIYTMDATGEDANFARLTAITGTGYDFQPFWVTATAGTYANQVVYSSCRGTDGHGQILSISPTPSATPAPATVLSISGQSLTWPTISPDGNLLAYGVTAQTLDAYKNDNTQVMEAHVRRLSDNADFVIVDSANTAVWAAAHTDAPAFSPDSHKLALYTNISGQSEIWVVDISQIESGAVAPGSFSPQQLTHSGTVATPNRWPVFSPDGTRMLYISGYELWTISSDPASTNPNPIRLTRTY